MPCTTILVGKGATYDGSTMIARNDDAGGNNLTIKRATVVRPEDQPRHYVSVISKVEIDLPEDPMRYTAVPNVLKDEGIWAAAGINAANVAMTATETITSNPRVLGADPLVEKGIGEEDLVVLTLPYIHSAREGVVRLGQLHEQYGTYEMNGIGIADVDEIWWFETIGGHHWIAKRVPDNSYVVMPNQQGIAHFDLTDAFGEQKEHMCSADLREFIAENHLDLTMDEEADETDLDVRAAFGSRSDSDHIYNTPRAWYMLRYLNPRTYKWDGPDAEFGPEDDDLPWSLVPEHKITVEDVKYVLSAHYQGTPYDCYAKYGDLSQRNRYRSIGINRTSFLALAQLRPYVPAEIAAIQWIAFASNAHNAFVPFYQNVDEMPEYVAHTGSKPNTNSLYWSSRMIAALADAHWDECKIHVERYQNKMHSSAHQLIAEIDKAYTTALAEKAAGTITPSNQGILDAFGRWLQDGNNRIARMAYANTQDLLDKVLYESSLKMRNGFNRSDA